MKKILALLVTILPLALVASPPPSREFQTPSTVVVRDGKAFDVGSGELYTGEVLIEVFTVNRRDQNKKISDTHYSKTSYYSAGVLEKETYRSGLGRPPGSCGAHSYSLSYENDRLNGHSIGLDNKDEIIWDIVFTNDIPTNYGALNNYVSYKDIEYRSGLHYLKEGGEPFTGFQVLFYPNGSLEYKWFFRNGMPDGTWVSFKQDGTVEKLFEYSNGKRHGLDLSYGQHYGDVRALNKNGERLWRLITDETGRVKK